MSRPLNILVINPKDKKGTLASTLREIYGEEFLFQEVEYTSVLHRGIESLKEAEFHFCFISSAFPTSDLESFFADVDQLGRDGLCSYLQVYPKIPEELDKDGLSSLGFHGFISELGTHADREALREAISKWSEREEVVNTKLDVESAMNIILRKIDDAASNLKRGVETKIDAVPSEFIELKTTDDEDILDSYFRKLNRKTEAAEPENADYVQIPDSVLARHLPKLEKNQYNGVSTRVWRRLLRKHGVEEEKKQGSQSGEGDSSLPSEE